MNRLQTVGKYEILSPLGAGSMGTVYRAFDPVLQRLVAIKMINLGWTQEMPRGELATRFRTEARAAAQLNHPAIVTIFDYDDQDPAGAYIAMEYVKGNPLDRYMEQEPELHLEDAVELMHQILAGLDYAHARGVIHRDIKPSNLLLTRNGLVKITDFGIAKMRSSNETQGSFTVGSPLYMAPEQYTRGPIDHRCDIHAAAAVFYELLTGAPPYTGTPAEVMYKICHEQPAPLAGLDPAIAKVFDPIIVKALEKAPENRYPSAAAFSNALRSAWRTLSGGVRAVVARRARSFGATTSLDSTVVEEPVQGDLKWDTWVIRETRQVREPAPDAPDAPDAPGTALAKQPGAPGELAPLPRPAQASRSTAVVASPRSLEPSLGTWSRDQLAEVERHLATIMGPVAQVLVRKAAARTASRQELYRLLANHLQTPEERLYFLAKDRSGGQVAPRQEVVVSPPPPSSGSARPVTAEVTQRASQLLARYLGPIATVLARRAALKAADEGQLYSMLAAKVDDMKERERFLAEAARRT